MKKLVWLTATLAMLVAFAPGHADAADYVGSKKCKMCHKNAYTAWEGSKHAQAFSAMEKEGATGKPECVKCHTTGYAGSGAVTEDQKNIGCERCHGAGADYMKVMMKKSSYTTDAAKAAGLVMPGNDGKFCTDNCHNSESPNFKEFKFEERWAQIKHELDKPRAH